MMSPHTPKPTAMPMTAELFKPDCGVAASWDGVADGVAVSDGITIFIAARNELASDAACNAVSLSCHTMKSGSAMTVMGPADDTTVGSSFSCTIVAATVLEVTVAMHPYSPVESPLV